MTFSLKASADGLTGELQIGGVPKVTVGSTGIQAGSYAPNSITATELAAGALVETSPSAAIGYGAGAGGTVTQATSKSTGVTLNKPCGQITMNAAALAAGASVQFAVNNSLLVSTDMVVAHLVFTGVTDPSQYTLEMLYSQAGAFYLRLTNKTGGALAHALPINFAIIKGAAA